MWPSSSSRGQSSRGQSSSQGSVRNTPPPPPPPPPQPLDENNRRNLSTRVVHGGRGINLPENEYGMLIFHLERLGWQNIPNFFNGFVCVPLVREFYENLFFYFENGDKTRPAIITRVAGQEILLNRIHLSNILGIPDDGECIFFKKSSEDFKNALNGVEEEFFFSTFTKPNYTGGKIGEKHLLDNFRNVNTFLEYDILPKSGTNNSVSKFQGFILYCIAVYRKINLAFIILMYIKNILQNQTMGLGYGALLTQIFSHLGIPVNNWETRPTMMPISQRTLNLRSSHPFHMGQQDEPQDNEEPDEGEPEDSNASGERELYYDYSQNRWV